MATTQAYSFDMVSFKAVESGLRAVGAALRTTTGGLQAASAAGFAAVGNPPMLKKSSADVKSLSPSSYIADQIFKKIFSLSSLVLPVKLALDRENQDADLQQALGVDASGMAAFRAELTGLSQAIPLTEKQLADLARQGAQIGVSKTELGDFVRNAARLGVAFRLSSEEAGNALARFRQDFHLSNEKAALLGDALGKLGEVSRVSVGELFAFSAAFGKTAASYGVQGEQAGALGAALLQTGMDAEGAGVAAGAVATRGMAAAQWLLNAALSNNPVGWVVKGIALLAGAMATLYNTCEPVRAVFDAVFRGIGEAISWVWDKLNKLGSGFKAVAGWFGFGDGEEKSLTGLEPEAPLLPATPPAMPEFPAPTPLVPLQSALPSLTAPLSLPSTMQEDAVFPGMDSMSSLGGLPGSGMMSGMAAPAGAGGGPMSFQLNVSLNGMTDADFGRRVMDGLKRRQGELEKLIAGIVDEQRRLAYD